MVSFPTHSFPRPVRRVSRKSIVDPPTSHVLIRQVLLSDVGWVSFPALRLTMLQSFLFGGRLYILIDYHPNYKNKRRCMLEGRAVLVVAASCVELLSRVFRPTGDVG